MPIRTYWANRFYMAAALALPIVIAGVPLPVRAQDQAQQEQQQPALTQQQIEQLVAPIALYPDALLAQMLTASTYPLQVAMAANYMAKNPNLKGAGLETAMESQSWDPSVKGLTSIPQVLAMMNDKLDWTEQLGEAFLAQPDDVQNAIQILREKAEAAGNLKSSKQQRVRTVAATPAPGYSGPSQVIVIEPVTPDYIYVPVYNPVVVYGAGFWPPAYVPFIWYPTWWKPGPVFGFSPVYVVGPALWLDFRWGRRGFDAVRINNSLYSKFNKVRLGSGDKFQNWKFDPNRRGNLAFKNPKLEQQFGKGRPGSKETGNRISPETLNALKGKTGKPGGNKGKNNLPTDKGVAGQPGGNKGKDNKLATQELTTNKGGPNKEGGKEGGNKGKNNLTTDKGASGKHGGNKITTERLNTRKGPPGNQGGGNKATTERFNTHKGATGNQRGNKGASGPSFRPSSVGSGAGGRPPGGGGNAGPKPSGNGGGGGGNRKNHKP